MKLFASLFFLVVVLRVVPGDALIDFYPVCDQVIALGYPCQSHYVPTSDGFILNVIRIPPKLSGAYPVYLQHGLLDSAVTWVANSNGFQNLATILHDRGYDVWMNNARGNHYSMTNTKYSQDDPMFWTMIDMDWMARYDLPAVIDHVLSRTGRSTLSYVGHSQGGFMGFAGFGDVNKQYAKKVDVFVGLAPACTVGHTTSFLVKLLADLDVADIIALFGVKEFLANDWLLRKFGSLCPDIGDVCPDVLDIMCGDGNSANVNRSNFASLLRYDPGGTSVNNMLHWAQLVQSGAFQMHDYGPVLNQQLYNQTTAPMYSLSNMEGPPTAVFYGSNDALADPADIAFILEKVPKGVLVNVTEISGYAHLDFVWGLDAFTRLYPQVLEVIAQHQKN
jgi:pimeloyl-ACP methyl ester carboxylesterase